VEEVLFIWFGFLFFTMLILFPLKLLFVLLVIISLPSHICLIILAFLLMLKTEGLQDELAVLKA
jgi:hypothetical protein